MCAGCVCTGCAGRREGAQACLHAQTHANTHRGRGVTLRVGIVVACKRACNKCGWLYHGDTTADGPRPHTDWWLGVDACTRARARRSGSNARKQPLASHACDRLPPVRAVAGCLCACVRIECPIGTLRVCSLGVQSSGVISRAHARKCARTHARQAWWERTMAGAANTADDIVRKLRPIKHPPRVSGTNRALHARFGSVSLGPFDESNRRYATRTVVHQRCCK